MQLQLDDVALFVRIAELGTLSAAARERNVPVSQATRTLLRLEAACGMRLFHRSTHGLHLSDEGDTFLAYAQRLLDTRAELQADLTGKRDGPNGWVRISVSPLLAECVIAPSLSGLYALHPGLHLDICADDRISDMVREGIDIALRTGSPSNQTLVARQIGAHGRTLYASPSYLQRHGTPHTVDDLATHHLIANSVSPALNRWPLRPPSRVAALQVSGHTRSDNTAVLFNLVLHGVGIARLNDLMAAPLVRSGQLVPLLHTHFDTTPTPIYAVMQPNRHRLPKIRACIDYWTQWIAEMDTPPSPPSPP